MPGRGSALLYTIGHSNQPIERFTELLRLFEIEAVADVRSIPRSQMSPQFDRVHLDHALSGIGVQYVFLGNELGGRPRNPAYYDDEGHVRYDLMLKDPQFERGLARLLEGAARLRIAAMCSEENPTGCHRRLLVGRAATALGAVVVHVRGDATLCDDDDLLHANGSDQGILLGEEALPWKSLRSVSPGARLSRSSRR